MNDDDDNWKQQFDKWLALTPAEQFHSFSSQDRLRLLSLWGMSPGWTPPECVQQAFNITYTTTPWPPIRENK